jgi:hypothetical protein
MLRFPGRPSLADFDLLGQKLQEDADPDWQEPTLPKIDSMQFVDVARVELLKNTDKPIGGDIIPDYERGQSNKSDTHEYRDLLRIPSSGKLNRSVQGAHHSDRFQQAEMMSGWLVKSIATIRIYSTHPRLG